MKLLKKIGRFIAGELKRQGEVKMKTGFYGY